MKKREIIGGKICNHHYLFVSLHLKIIKEKEERKRPNKSYKHIKNFTYENKFTC